MNSLAVELPTILASFLVTYFVHSSVAWVIWWGLLRSAQNCRPAVVEWISKGAVLVPLFTALAGTVVEAFQPWQSYVAMERLNNGPSRERPSVNRGVSTAEIEDSHGDVLGKAEVSFTTTIESDRAPRKKSRENEQSVMFRQLLSFARWLSVFWAGWALFFSAFLGIRSWRLVASFTVTAWPPRGPRRTLDRLLMEQKISRPVQLWISPKVSQPIAFGFIRWHIVLPSKGYRPSGAELKAVLAHELGHLVRSDWAWLLLGRWICGALPLQPLNRYVVNRWQSVSEFLADNWALDAGVGPSALAQCLLGYAESCQNPQDVTLRVTAVGPSDSLIERVNQIYCSRVRTPHGASSARSRFVRGLVAVGVSAVALIPGVTACIGTMAIVLPKVSASESSTLSAADAQPMVEMVRTATVIEIEIDGLRRDIADAKQLARESSAAQVAVPAIELLDRRAEKLLQKLSIP